MRSLYSILESIADSDEDIKNKVQSELIRQSVKEALIEFFNYLHIDVPNKDNSLNLERGILAKKKRNTLRFNMRNYIDWITKVPQRGSDRWYQDRTWEGMYLQNHNFINEALRKAFEKYLDKRHIKYKATKSNSDISYHFEDDKEMYIQFLLYISYSDAAKKEYDKQTKGGYKNRESYKSWGWQFKIDIPEDFWDIPTNEL